MFRTVQVVIDTLKKLRMFLNTFLNTASLRSKSVLKNIFSVPRFFSFLMPHFFASKPRSVKHYHFPATISFFIIFHFTFFVISFVFIWTQFSSYSHYQLVRFVCLLFFHLKIKVEISKSERFDFRISFISSIFRGIG